MQTSSVRGLQTPCHQQATWLYNAKDFVRAEADMRAAIDLQPNVALYHMALADTLHMQKKYSEAEAAARAALALEPRRVGALCSLSQSLLLQGPSRDEEAPSPSPQQFLGLISDPSYRAIVTNLSSGRR